MDEKIAIMKLVGGIDQWLINDCGFVKRIFASEAC